MSSFRSLAPSTQQDDSSTPSSSKVLTGDSTNASSANNDGGGGNSGGSDQRSDAGADGGNVNPRKRRTTGSVSQMACSPCRQARQRCDGQRPNRCGRCITRHLECVYEPHTKTHKDDLIREIESLRGDNTTLQNRNKAIEQSALQVDSVNRDLREEGNWQRIILQTIGSNGHDREIIRKLRAGESHQAIADWLVRQNPDFGSLGAEATTHRELVDVVKAFESQCQGQDGLYRFSADVTADIPWTNVSTSHRLLGHLFDLYFTWVHPVHMLFSELDFKQDFKNKVDTYCSAPLVNAICAMACHLLDGDHVRERRNIVDATTLADGFMAQAKATLTPETYHFMTSIQAFAVMYLVELSSGRARSATGYLRSAVENLKSTNGPEQSEEAKELTFWGVHTLNTFCIGITFQRLYIPPAPGGPIFQHVRMDGDDAVWRFYRRPGDNRELPFRPAHAIVTAYQQAKLFLIINETLNVYCGTRGKVTAAKILDVYARYLQWKDELPDVIANIEEGDQPLPHILYLHVQYHTALVHHFSPLLHGDLFVDSDLNEMRRIVLYHARSGIEPLDHSRRLYTSRFSLPILSFCLLQLCDVLVRYSPQDPPAQTVIKLCLEVLNATRPGFAVCGPLQSLFHQTAVDCGLEIPMELEDIVGSFNHYLVDDILDACTRLTYTMPFDQVLRQIDPELAQDWAEEWQKRVISRKGKARRESTSGRYLQVANLLNN